MARGRFPGKYGAAQVCARILGWMTSIATILILSFIINRWDSRASAVAAGLVGAAIAALNDSWIVLATIDRSLGFQRMSAARALLHDLFSLAISLGGIVMIIFSRYSYSANGFALTKDDDSGDDFDDLTNHGIPLHRMLELAIWILVAVVLLRFIFVIWGCFDCFREFRTVRVRVRNRMIERARI